MRTSVWPLITLGLLLTMPALAGPKGCAGKYANLPAEARSRPIALADDPSDFLRVLNGTASREEIPDEQLLKVLNREINEEADDALDFEGKRSRSHRAMSQYFRTETPENYETRLRKGDLRPIAKYVEEVYDPVEHVVKVKDQTYYRVNSALADNTFQELERKDPALARYIHQLDRALTKLPPVEGIVYRGTSIANGTVTDILAGKQTTIDNRTFVSTSLDVFDALMFASKKAWSRTDTPTLIVLHTRNGRMISYGTDFAREEEVLIPRSVTGYTIERAFKARPNRVGEESPEYLVLFLKEAP